MIFNLKEVGPAAEESLGDSSRRIVSPIMNQADINIIPETSEVDEELCQLIFNGSNRESLLINLHGE